MLEALLSFRRVGRSDLSTGMAASSRLSGLVMFICHGLPEKGPVYFATDSASAETGSEQ